MEDQNGDSLGKRVEVTMLSGRTKRGTVQAVEHGYTTVCGKSYQTTTFEVLMEDETRERTASGWVRELGPEWAEELLPQVRQYAQDRYEEGWSPLVECDSSRIIETVVKRDLRDLEAVVKHYKPIMEVMHSRYMDMRSLADGE